jgi:hypothetical protein
MDAQKGAKDSEHKPGSVNAEIAAIASAIADGPSGMQQHNGGPRCRQEKHTSVSAHSVVQDRQQGPDYNQRQSGEGQLAADGIIDLELGGSNKASVRIARWGMQKDHNGIFRDVRKWHRAIFDPIR